MALDSDTQTPAPNDADAPDKDTPKRRQILSGARDVFRAKGFDGASMDQIARAAGVSKGTLYVYFQNKEDLFKALILEERIHQADTATAEGLEDQPVETLLREIGLLYLRKFLRPEKLSTLRMVLGATEKFPEFGALLFEAGPKAGRRQLTALIEARIRRGELQCEDAGIAASQFADLCGSWMIRQALFMPQHSFTEAEIHRNVDAAVKVFLAAYGVKA